ncbi:MAG: right-handed parallel beta-helix repeat-containing protein [Verrucomicrobiota bacterium]
MSRLPLPFSKNLRSRLPDPPFLALIGIAVLLIPNTQAGTISAPANIPSPTQEIPWAITGSAGGTSDDFYGGVELLYPLWFDGDTLLFLYPEVEIADKDRQSYALGLGLRHYFEEWNAIAGVSAFWDITSSTFDNTYNGFGLSGEILTKWVDARLNWYLNSNDQNLIDAQTQNSSFSSSSSRTSFGAPFAQGNQILQPTTTTTTTTTTNISQTFERFEAAMDGLDVEAGILIPYFTDLTGMELRLFAGYYTYDNPFGEDLQGFKARGELRITKWLTGDIAYFEDEELYGGNVYGGARVHFPLGKIERPVHIAGGHVSPSPATSGAGKHSVAKAPVQFAVPAPDPDSIAHRLTENIIRNPRIITADSGYIENDKKRRESTKTAKETTHATKVVLNDVVFVNNGPATDEGVAAGIEGKKKSKKKTGAQRGTAENPAFTIQGGVDIAENKVHQGWDASVFVQGGGPDYVEDVNIATSLALYGSVPAHGGYSFGGNTKPVINGGIGAVDVDYIKVNAFTINNGRTTSTPGSYKGNGGLGDGIYLESVDYVHITNNMINDARDNDSSDGLHINQYGGEDLMAVITGNRFNFNLRNGANIEVEDGGSLWLKLENNSSTNNTGAGFHVETAGKTEAWIKNNIATGNEIGEGIRVVTNDFYGDVLYNQTNDNGNDGLEISAYGNFEGIVAYNESERNNDAGILLDVSGWMKAKIKNNRTNNNNAAGFRIGNAPGNNGPTAFTGSLWGNTANENGAEGITVFLDAGPWEANVDYNTTNGNNGSGLHIQGVDHFTGKIVSNTANGNTTGDGILIETLGDMTSMIKNNTAHSNNGDGIRIGDAAGDNGPSSFTGSLWGNTANDNGDDGIVLFVDDGHWNANIDYNTAHNNSGQGIHILGVTDFNGDIAYNEANGNTDGNGILIEALGAMKSRILSNTTNDNSNDGFRVGDAAGNNGPSSFAGTIRGNTANNNTDGLEVFIDGGNFNGNVEDNTANSNVEKGIQILGANNFNGNFNSNTANENGGAEAAILLMVDNDFNGNFKHNTANDNENSGGIRVTLPGNFTGNFHRNSANNNGTNSNDDGIFLDIEGYFDGDLSFNNANANGSHGIRLGQGDDSNGVTAFFGNIAYNTTNGNSSDGQDYIVEGEFTGDIKYNTANTNGENGFQILGIDNFEGDIKHNTASFNFGDGFRAAIDDAFIGDFSYNTGNNNVGSGGDGIKLEDVDVFTGNATGNTGNNNGGNGIESSAGFVIGGVNGIFFHGGNTANGNSDANFNNNPTGFVGP